MPPQYMDMPPTYTQTYIHNRRAAPDIEPFRLIERETERKNANGIYRKKRKRREEKKNKQEKKRKIRQLSIHKAIQIQCLDTPDFFI